MRRARAEGRVGHAPTIIGHMPTRQPGRSPRAEEGGTVPTGVTIRDVREQLFGAAERILLRDGPDALTSRAVAASPAVPPRGRTALLRRRAEQQPAQRRHALLQFGHPPGQLSHPCVQPGLIRPQRGGRGLQLRDPRLGPPGPGTPATDISILIDHRHGKHMIQHTPLQQPRHASNPACRDPGAPRPTGSPITYASPKASKRAPSSGM